MRRQRENIFKHVCKTAGREPFTRIDRKTIVAGRDRRRETPNAARHFVQAMRGLFEWTPEAEHVKADPTLGVKMVRPAIDGFHLWTDDECERFEKRWPAGTRERLAHATLTFTGLRRGDAVRFGRPHLVKKDGKKSLRIRTEKTGEVVTIPILPPLQASTDAFPIGEMTYLATASGKLFRKEFFGNWFRDACAEGRCPDRSTVCARLARHGRRTTVQPFPSLKPSLAGVAAAWPCFTRNQPTANVWPLRVLASSWTKRRTSIPAPCKKVRITAPKRKQFQIGSF